MHQWLLNHGSVLRRIGWWSAFSLSFLLMSFASRSIYTYSLSEAARLEFHDTMYRTNPALIMLSEDDNLSFPQLHENRYYQHPYLTFGCHIILVYLWATIVPAQFHPTFRENYKKIHRFLGRLLLCVSAIMILSAFAFIPFEISYSHGLDHPTSPFTENTAIVFGGGLFLIFGVLAYWSIAKERNIFKHERWMMRHVGMGYTVGTMRVILFIESLILEIIDEPRRFLADYKKTQFANAFYLSMIINISFVEILIYANGIRTKSQ